MPETQLPTKVKFLLDTLFYCNAAEVTVQSHSFQALLAFSSLMSNGRLASLGTKVRSQSYSEPNRGRIHAPPVSL